MSVRRLAAGTVATAIATLALCGSASAHIYWANEGLDTITRASNAGVITDQDFISGAGVATDPLGVAINGTHIYWSHDEGTGGSIGRANIDGTGATATLIPTTGDPAAVGLDANLVYWTHAFGGPPAGWIGRATLSGFVPPGNQTFQPTATTSPCGVTANGDRAWWANEGGPENIESAHGGDPPDEFVSGTFTNDPCGVALQGSHIYWANQAGASGTIGRSGIDGSNPDLDFVDMGAGTSACGVAVDDQHIYWTDPVNDDIGRADLNGSNPDPDFISDPAIADPCGISVTPTQQAQPTAHDFGQAPVGGQSDIQSFNVANTASSVLDVTGVALIGANPDQFQLTGDGCTPARTSAGLGCILNVLFSPTAEGTANATLRVTSNASNSPTVITLTGTATAPPPGPDPTPAADTEPPETAITAGPPGKTKKKKAHFEFSSSEPGSSFECRLDDGSFEPCTSPDDDKVGKGKHSFEVRATDAAGNADPTPATRSWTVKKRKPKK